MANFEINSLPDIDIVKNLISACAKDKEKGFKEPHENLQAQVLYYTCADSAAISRLLDNMPKWSSLQQSFHDYNILKNPNSPNTTKSITNALRKAIVHLYLTEKLVPTISLLSDCLKDSILSDPNEIKINLKKAGYMWKQIEGKSKAILIENPEQACNRQNYLESIKKYRDADCHIVYIAEKNISKWWNFVAVSSAMGVITSDFPGIETQELTHENMASLKEEWIVKTVLPLLSIPSVLVFEEKAHHEPCVASAPTIGSSKKDMLEWLTFHNIPHNAKWHRAEIFEIVKRSKRHFPDKIFKLDEILNGHGHKVLRRPRKLYDLDIFDPIWEQILQTEEKQTGDIDVNKNIIESLSSITLQKWAELEKAIQEKENTMYQEDIALEHVTNKILTLAKYEPSCFDNYVEEIYKSLNFFVT